MKKVIKTMMMMLVASTFVLTSCKDDGDEGDTTIADVVLTLNPAASAGTHFVGDTLKLVVNGKGNTDNNLTKLTITRAPQGKATETIVDEKLTGTDKIYNLEEIYKLEDIGTITYTIKLEGAKGAVQTKTYVATVSATSGIDEFSDVSLYSPETGSTLEGFVRLTNPGTRYGTEVTLDEWKANVDAAFFHGTKNGYTISSPSNASDLGTFPAYDAIETAGYFNAGNARITGFYKVSEANRTIYADVKNDPTDLDTKLVLFATGKTFDIKAKDLTQGDVVLFKTADGVLGLIQVKTLTAREGTNPSSINFDFLVQAK